MPFSDVGCSSTNPTSSATDGPRQRLAQQPDEHVPAARRLDDSLVLIEHGDVSVRVGSASTLLAMKLRARWYSGYHPEGMVTP